VSTLTVITLRKLNRVTLNH